MALDLTKTRKTKMPVGIFINVGAVMLSLALFITLWTIKLSPKKMKIRQLEEEAKTVETISKKQIAGMEKEKQRLIQEKNRIYNEIAGFEEKLRGKKDISTLLDQFIFTARKRRLEFTYIRPLPQKDIILKDVNIRLREVPISLELEAGYMEFVGFLWETENIDPYLRIKQLSIEDNPGNPARHKEKITVSVHQLIEENNGNENL